MTTAIRFLTLDATGTLLRPRARIGATYIAHWHRIAPSASSLSSSRREMLENAVDAQFPLVFRDFMTRFPNFGRGILSSESAECWWSQVILASLPQDLITELPAPVQRDLTAELYRYYASGEAWHVYDDVVETLETLRAQHVHMAVISDFDERLPRLLEDLGLASFFEIVTTSWEVGVAKPSPQIYRHTFEALGSREPNEFLHVGDHIGRDYNGARAVGAHARLLCRGHRNEDKTKEIPQSDVLTTLTDVVPLLHGSGVQ